MSSSKISKDKIKYIDGTTELDVIDLQNRIFLGTANNANMLNNKQANDFADINHLHNELYYTKSQIDNKLLSFFDAIVAQDGSGDYTTIQDAWNDGKRKLFIKKGNYIIDDETLFITDDREIALIGEEENSVFIKRIDPDNYNPSFHYNRYLFTFADFDYDKYFVTDSNTFLTYDELTDSFWFHTDNISFLNDIHLQVGKSFHIITSPFDYYQPIWDDLQGKFVPDTNTINSIKKILFYVIIQEIDLVNNKIRVDGINLDFRFPVNGNISVYMYGRFIFETIPIKAYDDLNNPINATIYPGNDTLITNTPSNFTTSLKEGYFLVFGNWNGECAKIKQVVDDSTVIFEDPILLGMDRNIENYIYCIKGTPKIILKNITFNKSIKIIYNNILNPYTYIYTPLSNLYAENCVFFDDVNYDSYGYKSFFLNCTFKEDSWIGVGNKYMFLNCKITGIDATNKDCYFISCVFEKDAVIISSSSAYNSFISCYFNSSIPNATIQDFINFYSDLTKVNIVGCFFNGVLYSGNIPQTLQVQEIVFPYGKLTSSYYGLLYQENTLEAYSVNITQDKYTWVINDVITEELQNIEIDGPRLISFSGNLVSVKFTAKKVDPQQSCSARVQVLVNGGLTFDSGTFYWETHVVNIGAPPEVLENSILTIRILECQNLRDACIEVIERK